MLIAVSDNAAGPLPTPQIHLLGQGQSALDVTVQHETTRPEAHKLKVHNRSVSHVPSVWA